MLLNVVLSAFTVVFGALSQLFYKITLNSVGKFSFTWEFFINVLTSRSFILAIVFLLVQFVSWFYLLSRLPINVATSISIFVPVFSIIGGWHFLGEPIPVLRWIGFVVMLCGFLLVIKTV